MRDRFSLAIRTIVACSAVAAISFIAGCSDSGSNPPDNSNNNNTVKIPGPGSSYTFDGYNVDSLGVKYPGTDQVSIWTVTEVGLNHLGKSGVVKVVANSKEGYIKHETNGDLSTVWAEYGRWITLPFGSKGTVTYPNIDTNGYYGTEPVRIKSSGTATHIGEEDVVVNGETIRCQKVLNKNKQEIYRTGDPSPMMINESETTLWYSTKVGYYVKQYSVAATFFTPTSGIRQRIVGNLRSYSLK